LIKFGYLQKSL